MINYDHKLLYRLTTWYPIIKNTPRRSSPWRWLLPSQAWDEGSEVSQDQFGELHVWKSIEKLSSDCTFCSHLETTLKCLQQNYRRKIGRSENTYLLCKIKYNFTVDFLFDCFVFISLVILNFSIDLLVCLNLSHPNWRSAIHWYSHKLSQVKWTMLNSKGRVTLGQAEPDDKWVIGARLKCCHPALDIDEGLWAENVVPFYMSVSSRYICLSNKLMVGPNQLGNIR